MDSALAFKAKINNSYESEPSSGSGSSLSENNDYLGLDVDNINLPSLLRPRIDESVLNSNIEMQKNGETSFQRSEKSLSARTPAYLSSQESPFRGFSESPFEKIKLRLIVPPNETGSHQLCQGDGNKLVAEEFYDTILGENSCNAVDMALTSQEEECREQNTNNTNKLSERVSSSLSFNGRIKVLSAEAVTVKKTTYKRKREDDEEVDFDAMVSAQTAQFTESFVVREYNKERSPDLFADEEDEAEAETEGKAEYIVCDREREENNSKLDYSTKDGHLDISANQSLNCPTESSFADEPTMDCTSQCIDLKQRLYRDNCKRERELLRRIRKCLSGVPPPPSLTTPQVDLIHMVLSRKNEILNFFKQPPFVSESLDSVEQPKCFSLFKPTHTLKEVEKMEWRDILGVRCHGLSYNLTKASESNEYLGLSVIERFVGSETNSSYKRSPSSAKKRNARLKLLTQSPGNRLSHLAKRRAVFSSAHLATNLQKSTSSLGPQIIIDKKKAKHRRKATPKRKTPASKKKVRKTPSSSARKRLFRCETTKLAPSRETSKRALFQSPARCFERQLVLPKPQIKPEIATRVEKSKRALFSPDSTEKSSSQPSASGSLTQAFESLLKRKRSSSNYDDDVDELSSQSSKYLRMGENLTPRALKIKSQSFCIGAGSSTSSLLATSYKSIGSEATAFSRKLGGLGTSSATSLTSAISNSSLSAGYCGSNSSLIDRKIPRAHSDMPASATGLTENQKKKLLWAVSQALQEKKITTKHENFKQFASVLARVVRRIFQEYYQRTSTSTSETMLRLAKKYVYYVISGRSADEIYLHIKSQLDESKRMSTSRLTGYIGPEEYQQLKKQQQLSQTSLASSLSFRGSMQNLFSNENSIDSFGSLTQLAKSSQQMSLANHCQTVSIVEGNRSKETLKSATKQRPIDENPSHKNSSSKSNLGILALRENSGQKNFTGKDQRNVSPYIKTSGGDSFHVASSAKAKRQILFDS